MSLSFVLQTGPDYSAFAEEEKDQPAYACRDASKELFPVSYSEMTGLAMSAGLLSLRDKCFMLQASMLWGPSHLHMAASESLTLQQLRIKLDLH